MALSRVGLDIRVKSDQLAEARKFLRPCDARYTDTNRGVRITSKYTVQGLQPGTSAPALVASLSTWGWQVVPLKSWMDGERLTWLVGADAAPKKEGLVTCTCGSLVVTQSLEPAWAKTRKDRKPLAPARKAAQVPRPGTPMPAAAPRNEGDTPFEQRLTVLETRHAALEERVESGFARVEGTMNQRFDEIVSLIEHGARKKPKGSAMVTSDYRT